MSSSKRQEEGFALVVSLVLLLLLVILGTALLSLSGVESEISHNDEWAESALHAAEAGLNVAIDSLQPDPVASTNPTPLTVVSDDVAFRSGNRLSGAASRQTYLGKTIESGFSITVGTGYNPSGYSFTRYRLNATGDAPRGIRRELEALTLYGPIPE